jgi:hypothetical protein
MRGQGRGLARFALKNVLPLLLQPKSQRQLKRRCLFRGSATIR